MSTDSVIREVSADLFPAVGTRVAWTCGLSGRPREGDFAGLAPGAAPHGDPFVRVDTRDRGRVTLRLSALTVVPK
jgi:hypothetical protein